jgi:cytochrome c oxidase subunit I+III
MRMHLRDTLVSTVIEAKPSHLHEDPRPTIMPLVSAIGIGVTFISALFTPWGFVVGIVITAVPLILWGYPRKHHPEAEAA